jgi:hypothetical protein
MKFTNVNREDYGKYVLLLLMLIFLVQVYPHIDSIKNAAKTPLKSCLLHILNKNDIISLLKEFEDICVLSFCDIKEQDFVAKLKEVEKKYIEYKNKK